MSLTSIIGPFMMTNLFYFFTKDNAPVHFPGVSFLLGGLLMLASAVLAYMALKQRKDRCSNLQVRPLTKCFNK